MNHSHDNAVAEVIGQLRRANRFVCLAGPLQLAGFILLFCVGYMGLFGVLDSRFAFGPFAALLFLLLFVLGLLAMILLFIRTFARTFGTINVADAVERKADFRQRLAVVAQYHERRRNSGCSEVLVEEIAAGLIASLRKKSLLHYVMWPKGFISVVFFGFSAVVFVGSLTLFPDASAGYTARLFNPFDYAAPDDGSQWILPDGLLIAEPNKPLRMTAVLEGKKTDSAILSVIQRQDSEERPQTILAMEVAFHRANRQTTFFEAVHCFPEGRYHYTYTCPKTTGRWKEFIVGQMPCLDAIQLSASDPNGQHRQYRLDKPFAVSGLAVNTDVRFFVQVAAKPVIVSVYRSGTALPVNRGENGDFEFAMTLDTSCVLELVLKNARYTEIATSYPIELSVRDEPAGRNAGHALRPPMKEQTSKERQQYIRYHTMLRESYYKTAADDRSPLFDLKLTLERIVELADEIRLVNIAAARSAPSAEREQIIQGQLRVVAGKKQFYQERLDDIAQQAQEMAETADRNTSDESDYYTHIASAAKAGSAALKTIEPPYERLEQAPDWLRIAGRRCRQAMEAADSGLALINPENSPDAELLRKAAALSAELYEAIQAGVDGEQLDKLLVEVERFLAELRRRGLLHDRGWKAEEGERPSALASDSPVYRRFEAALDKADIAEAAVILRELFPKSAARLNMNSKSSYGDLRYRNVEAAFYKALAERIEGDAGHVR